MVSIVIPTFNSEETIAATLDSIKKQSYQDFEVLIVDDGSSDKTQQIVEEYAQVMKLSFHPIEHSGCPGKVRNAGIKLAQGEYIALIDSDDIILPHKLLLEVQLLDYHKDIDLVFTNFRQIVDGKEQAFGWLDQKHVIDCMNQVSITIINEDMSKFEAPIPELLLQNNFIGTSTVMCRKKALEDVGLFNNHYVGIEDRAMWITLSMKGKLFGIIHKISSLYLVRSDSVARSERALRSHIKYYSDLLIDSDYRGYMTYIHKHLAKNYYALIHRNRLNGQYGEALHSCWKVFCYGDNSLKLNTLLRLIKLPFNFLKDLFFKK